MIRRDMDVSLLSGRYQVRCLTPADVPEIYTLCKENPLFYRHCPPFVTEQSILDDMQALPPNKTSADKFYVGYYDGTNLIAIMDLIRAYPRDEIAFIGFFMTAADVQNAGIGTGIITELCGCLKDMGFSAVRLGWVPGNPQAVHFWHKNGFRYLL